MTAWTSVLEKVTDAVNNLGCSDPWYRGQSDVRWPLVSRLGRLKINQTIENRLLFDFRLLGAHLIPRGAEDWEILVLMQHHGVPTRLLDWTETFAVAAYFAVRSAQGDAAVWILNPYELNRDPVPSFHPGGSIPSFPLSKSYDYYCLRDFESDDASDKHQRPAQAVMAPSGATRVRLQRAAFTLHGHPHQPLESLYPNVVRKVVIPTAALPEGRNYLRFCGVNEFSLFQDLDALARYLVGREIEDA